MQEVFLFHYIVFYFLSKNTHSEGLATMAVQNKLKEYHCAMFSLSGFQQVIQLANAVWFSKSIFVGSVSNLLVRIKAVDIV